LIAFAASPTGELCAARFAQAGFDLVLVDKDLHGLEVLGLRLHAAFGVATELVSADVLDGDDLARIERHLMNDPHIESFAFAASGPGLVPARASVNDLKSALVFQCVSATRLFSAAAAARLDARQGILLLAEAHLPALSDPEHELIALSRAYLRDFMRALHENLARSRLRVEHISCTQPTQCDIHAWQVGESAWFRRGVATCKIPPMIIE